jgi:hypothetical protein
MTACNLHAAFRRGLFALSSAAALAASPALLAAGEQAGAMDHAEMDHSGMDHSTHQMDTGRDALGRRLWGQPHHQMTEAMYEELRAKVPAYHGVPKSVIDMQMVQMGQEYQWYISPGTLKSDAGVLIMTHGFREQGDKSFKEQLTPLASALPTSLSLGMGMMMSEHVQLSIDDLEAAGVNKIVVVPIVSTPYNELMRQWEYILGMRKEAEFVTVPQARHKAKIVLAAPPGDDPLVAEILIDHALEISTDPRKEKVIIVAHGASGRMKDQDNPKELKLLENLARLVREDGGFAEASGFTLQDDAPPAIRDANVARLRGIVETAVRDGKSVLVVTNLIGARTIQPKLRADLKGLDYKFNPKGISQHPNFIEWIGEAVRAVLEKPERAATGAATSTTR